MTTRAGGVPNEQERWPRVVGAPHPGLRPLLACQYAGFTEATEPGGGFVLPATTSVVLVLKMEESALRPPQFVNGAHGVYAQVDGPCAPSYVEIRLAPLAGYPMLGLPMDELAGQLVDLSDVLGHDGRRLGDLVRDTSDWAARFRVIDQFLLRRLNHGPRVSPEVAFAWSRLVATGGAMSVRRLAGETGWSHKHLITRFRQQVGVPPKRAARLVRFDRVLRRLDDGRPEWAQLAAELGYADQAHLVREFREFTGTSPGAFLAARQPRSAHDDVAVGS